MAKAMKHIWLVLLVVLLVVLGALFLRAPKGQPPKWRGQSARLPCLANDQCPMGNTCNNGFCAEGFTAPLQLPMNDMSSCTAPQCKGGVNSPCSRMATPCAEGTFCQGDKCISVTTPDMGEAYNQIGMLST